MHDTIIFTCIKTCFKYTDWGNWKTPMTYCAIIVYKVYVSVTYTLPYTNLHFVNLWFLFLITFKQILKSLFSESAYFFGSNLFQWWTLTSNEHLSQYDVFHRGMKRQSLYDVSRGSDAGGFIPGISWSLRDLWCIGACAHHPRWCGNVGHLLPHHSPS